MSRSHARLPMGVQMQNYTPNDASLVGHFTGINVKLGDLQQQIDDLVPPGTGVVTTWNTRTGDVVPATSDYDAIQVDYAPGGGVSATNVQTAIAELDTDKANVVHQHQLSDITDSGALAALDTVGEAQIDPDSVGPSELKSTAVAPGSYTTSDLTVDAQGRITAIANGALETRVALLEQIIVETRVAFHGAILRLTDDPDANIGAGWQPLDNFESIAIAARGCSVALNGEFSFDREGAWELAASFNLSHNESNQGRETNIRLFNVTTATPGQTAPIAIARNQPGTNWYNSLPFTLLVSEIGDTYRLEIGGGDTLSSVVWNQKQITLRYLGEVGGLIDPTP